MTYQLTQIQEQMATLLSALQYYKDEGDSTWLESAISNVALYACVEMFGEIGEAVAYAPLAHYVTDYVDGKLPEQVEVMLAGVRAVREDGSHRILTRAIVKPA